MRRLNLLYLAGLVVVALCMAKPSPALAAYGDYLSSISAGSLNQPAKVAVDQANGDVYVTDAGNKQVKKYDKNGTYVAAFSLAVAGTPVGIAVNASNIFVGDDTNDCVWIYDKNGSLSDLYYTGSTHKVGGAGSHYTIKMPDTVAVAPSGHIFVLDGDNDKGYIYDAGGNYVGTFGSSGVGPSSGTNIYTYYPSGLAFGSAVKDSPSPGLTTQYFFLGDQGNYKVQKLSYVYNTTEKFISTMPTWVQDIGGTRTDAFGRFLRLSDLAWDSTYSRLVVADSLQMVGQLFDNNSNTLNQAFNYSGTAVQGNLNVPTGVAFNPVNQTVLIASNQSDSVQVFSAQQGIAPTISITDPATPVTPVTTTYPVAYTVNDADSTSETLNFYYYNTSAPGTKILIATQPITLDSVTHSYSGTISMDLVGTYPNYMLPGTYQVYAEARDEVNNLSTATSSTITIVSVSGKYTPVMQAKWGAPTADFDGDGITNADEINGTMNTAYGNAPTDPANPDTDQDGLDDGVEMGVKYNSSTGTYVPKYTDENTVAPITAHLLVHTDPNNPDTDGDGVSDGVEVVKGTDPTNGSDGLSSTQDLVADYFIDATQNQSTWFDITNPSTTTNAVVDLVFYNINGTVYSKLARAYYLHPNQTARFFPKSVFGASEGSLEIRSNVSNLKADLVRYRQNANNSASIDSGGSINLWMPTDKANKLMCATYFDGAYRYSGWLYLKNWSDTTAANVTVKYYDWADPTQFMSNVIVLGPHETKIIRPSSTYGDTPDGAGQASFGSPNHYGKGYLEVTSDNATVTGNMYIDRMDAFYNDSSNANYQTWDFSWVAPLISNVGKISYQPGLTAEIWRYFQWIYIANPNVTVMNGTIKFYNQLGTEVLTRNFSIPPHAGNSYRVSGNVDMGDGSGPQPMLNPGDNISTNFNGTPPSSDPNSPAYYYTNYASYVIDTSASSGYTGTTGGGVATDLPHVASLLTERWNPYGLSWNTGYNTWWGNTFDYGFYTNNLLNIPNAPYVSSYYDNMDQLVNGTANMVTADGRLCVWLLFSNFNDTMTTNVYATYYDAAGNPAKTGSITAGTNSLTMNTVSGLYTTPTVTVPTEIAIAGITGVKTVTAINGNVVTLDSNADATVTNAVVSIVHPIAPHAFIIWSPNMTKQLGINGGDGAPQQGSIKLSSDNGVAGYQEGQEYNYTASSTGNAFFDYAFAKTFWPTQ